MKSLALSEGETSIEIVKLWVIGIYLTDNLPQKCSHEIFWFVFRFDQSNMLENGKLE